MKNWIIRVVVCCFFMLIASCANRTVPINYVACIASCESSFGNCSGVCGNNCSQCRAAALQKTAKNYSRYKNEKIVAGKIVALQLNSFRDPLQCRKVTCNCQADYMLCLQACGRAIPKRLEYAPLCS